MGGMANVCWRVATDRHHRPNFLNPNWQRSAGFHPRWLARAAVAMLARIHMLQDLLYLGEAGLLLDASVLSRFTMRALL